MTPSNGNGADWATAFTSFHDRHRGKDGKKLKFTGVFNAHMDAFMMEAEVPLAWRVLAWTWRYAWGNNSDFCVDKIGGDRIGQTKCAADLKVEKQRISDEVVFLRGLNFICPNTGHKLYPVDDPLQEPQKSAHPENPKVRPLADFREFCEEWKVRSLADFQKLESAEETVKRLKIIRLGQFREWQKARRARTNAGASLIQPLQPLQPVCVQEKEQAAGGRLSAVVEQPATVEPAPARPPDPLVYGLKKRKLLPDGDLLDAVRYVIGEMPVEEFFWVLDDRLKRGRITTGLLMDMAKKAAKQWEANAPPPPPKPDPQLERQQAEMFLASGDEIPEDLKEWARGVLGIRAGVVTP